MSVEIAEIISQSFSGILGGTVVVIATWIIEKNKNKETQYAVLRQKLEEILFLSEDAENYIHTERMIAVNGYIVTLTNRNSALKGYCADETLKLESLITSNEYKTIRLESMIRTYASELYETVIQIRKLETQIHNTHADLVSVINKIDNPIDDLQQAGKLFLQKTDKIVMELKVKHDQLRSKAIGRKEFTRLRRLFVRLQGVISGA